MSRLAQDSKVALVTGASRGIGRACALRLAQAGYDVVVNYRSHADEAAEVAREISALGRDAATVQADVSRADAVEAMMHETLARWGRIDALVNNAGSAAIRAFDDLSVDEWDRLMDVNLKSAFLCCQRVIPIMKEQRAGRIIMLASQAGQTGGYFIGAHYSVSKSGVICLTKYLAKQLAPWGILVNCVAPGIIDTEMSAAYPPELVTRLVGDVPLRRVGTPDDVAHAVVFLAGAGSAYITGATLNVNGGLYMA